MEEKLKSCIFAKMIDHSLLHPGLTDCELVEECKIAREYHVASVSVKPYHVKLAGEILAGSDVLVGSVVGFPHGNSHIAIKEAETQLMLDEGAMEVDMVVNIGKVLDEDWGYIEREIGAIVALTKPRGALLKVIFENDMLCGNDELKKQLCRICSKLRVEFVKTSTGYCYNKEPDGRWSYQGATDHDLKLMREYSAPEVQVKGAGKVGDLDAMIRVRALGVTRVGTKNTVTIIRDAIARFGE